MKITATEVFVLGDPQPLQSPEAGIAALAFVRIHTDEGISGLSEIFAVPPGVAKAVLDGSESFFGQQLWPFRRLLAPLPPVPVPAEPWPSQPEHVSR